MIRDASAQFRNYAKEAADSLGYQRYEIKSLTIQRGEGYVGMPVPMSSEASVQSMQAKPAVAPVFPAEGGETQITVTISGTVDMARPNR
jgi:predicted secreted protein